MKRQINLALVLVVAFMISGCARNSATAVATVIEESVLLEDKVSLISALQAAGASVETGESVSQDFFTPKGTIIKVNGVDIQLFEYESTEAREEEASQVAPDGSSIGTSMVTWVDAPHFHKTGRIIVLYLGSDDGVLSLLEKH